nr:hypothetical protein [Tanacetum cinerariifolium]
SLRIFFEQRIATIKGYRGGKAMESQGWSMVLGRVMWRLFVVVGGRGILRDQGRRCGFI